MSRINVTSHLSLAKSRTRLHIKMSMTELDFEKLRKAAGQQELGTLEFIESLIQGAIDSFEEPV